MADNSLQTKITADVTDLQTKSAIAKAELAAQGTAVRQLSKEYIAASEEMKSAVASQLASAVTAFEEQKAELKSLQAQMKETAAAAAESSGAFGKISATLTESTEKIEALSAQVGVISKFASALGEFALAGLGVEKVADAVEDVAERGEKLERLSQITGLTTEQLSGLQVMAEQTGTDFDSFSKVIEKLPGTMQEAVVNPSSKAAEAFRAMGISITDANGQLLSVGQILDEVSAKLASYADGANKTALETDIFGSKIGADLIPMLNQLGQVGLQGAIEKSNELSLTLSGEQAEADEKFVQDMNRMKLGVEGLASNIIEKAIPALDALAKGFSEITGTDSIDDKISGVEAQIAARTVNRGRFPGADLPTLNAQLAALEAQKAQLDASVAAQSAAAGGAAPGTVQAPNLTGSASLGQHQGVGANDVADEGDNTADYSDGGGGDGGVSKAKAAQDQITQIAQDAAQARKEIQDLEYQTQVSNWDAEVSQGKLSKAQEIQNEIAAQDQIYQAQVQEMQQEAALMQNGTAAKAKELDDIEVLTAQHNAELARLNDEAVSQQVADAQKAQDAAEKAAQATAAAWQKAFAPISQAFDSTINGVLQGTETLQQGELKAAQSIALSYIDAAAKKLTAWVASEAQMLAQGVATQAGLTAAVATGNASRLASQVSTDEAGRSESLTLGEETILSNAAKAASGAYAAVAGIPLVGPALAPVAAATAYAGVLAFDVLSAEAGMVVPAGVNPLTQLHENEMVLPSHIAQPLTEALASNNFTNNSSSVGDTNFHFSQTVNGVSSDAAGTIKDAGQAWMAQILDLSRNGTLRLPGR